MDNPRALRAGSAGGGVGRGGAREGGVRAVRLDHQRHGKLARIRAGEVEGELQSHHGLE